VRSLHTGGRRFAWKAEIRHVQGEADCHRCIRLVVDVEAQLKITRKAEVCGGSPIEFEAEVAADQGPSPHSPDSHRASAVDDLVHTAVIAQADQHDVDAHSQDQREIVVGLPDVGTVDTQRRVVHTATVRVLVTHATEGSVAWVRWAPLRRAPTTARTSQ
jgi:hypothetical protein